MPSKNKDLRNFRESRIDFVKYSKYFYIFAIVVTLGGIISLASLGLNYGVDFSSGSSVDVQSSKNLESQRAEVETFLTDGGYGKHNAPSFGQDRMTIRFDEVLSQDQENKLKTDLKAKFDPAASVEVNTVDVEIAREMQWNALKAMIVASIGIVIYMAIRFEWRFGLAAIVSLVHDAFLVISIFSVFRLEVNLPFIVAILTIIGYSINDTIVIFDRIRENLRFAKIKSPADLRKLVNDSVWQTMTRSINTAVTVLFAAAALFVLGSESIRLFSLAILIGLFCGAYSSIFIASPLWLLMKSKSKPKQAPAGNQAAS
ncbi:protein translocase subunit SecF [Paenibacillus albicereus]|uniref:Protein-export membrane protein SecF n=1 Tax=Paenibacillus albicereus TaxID=2726185 RepID=A0A6H2GZL9_9BACL|nr:protein translocase subunit SecF [Paenibacillus albicereus]QJC52860.1 protein translocase subunit SecF [Paenibacillus albicereus]